MLFILAGHCLADGTTWLLIPEQDVTHRAALTELQAHVPALRALPAITTKQLSTRGCQQGDAFVALSYGEARSVGQQGCSNHVLFMMGISHLHRVLSERFPHMQLTTITMDRPPGETIELVSQVMPGRSNVALISMVPRNDIAHLPVSVVIPPPDQPPEVAISRAMETAGVVVLDADPLILNRRNAAAVMAASLRNRVPVVGGPAPGWVQAGLAMALFASGDSIAKKTAELLSRPPSQWPGQTVTPDQTALYVHRGLAQTFRFHLDAYEHMIYAGEN